MLLIDAGQQFSRSAPQWAPNRVLGDSTDGICFAPPALREVDGNFCISQQPAILNYLGRKHGYVPTDLKEAAIELQVQLDVCDIGGELFKVGRDAEGKAKFLEERLPNWFAHLNRHYEKKTGPYLLGDKLYTADFVFIVTMDALDFALGADNVSAICPDGLKACRNNLSEKSFYATYLATAKPILFEAMKA
jgi:hypothetical protein